MEITSIFAQQLWNGLIIGMVYVLFALSLNLITGVLGIINMAQGELYMLGAVVLWAVTMLVEVNIFIGLGISFIVVGSFGLLLNIIAIKPIQFKDPLSVLLSTIAVSNIIIYGITILIGSDTKTIVTPFKGSVKFLGALIPVSNIIMFFIGTAAIASIFLLLKTNWGKALRATAQDRIGASLVGINTERIYASTVAIASGFAALVGGIMAPIVTVHGSMGESILLKGFAVMVISGMGKLKECVIVGFAIGIMETLFGQYMSTNYREVFVFGLLIIVALLRPQGIFSWTKKVSYSKN